MLVSNSAGITSEVADDYVKLCKNCSFVLGQRQNLNVDTARCSAKQNHTGINLVTGDKILATPLCKDQRTTYFDNKHCGPEGNWFQLYIYPTETYAPKPAVKSAVKGLDLRM